jgi:hypothetical protein
VFGEPGVRIVTLIRCSKKHLRRLRRDADRWYDSTRRRDLPGAKYRIMLDVEVRRVAYPACGAVKRERLEFLADKRFAYYIGRRCRQASVRNVAKELKLTSSEQQLKRMGSLPR